MLDGKSSDHILEFPRNVENLLTESQPLGCWGHPLTGVNWTIAEGTVCSPRLFNTGPVATRKMPLYEEELVYFEHRLDTGVGYSGGPLVNINGDLVGMQTGYSTNKYYALGIGPVDVILTGKEREIRNQYRSIALGRTTQTPTQSLEQKIKDVKVPLHTLRYGRTEFVQIEVPISEIKFAIHAEYLLKKLRIQSTEFVDYYLGDLGASSSSSPAPASSSAPASSPAPASSSAMH